MILLPLSLAFALMGQSATSEPASDRSEAAPQDVLAYDAMSLEELLQTVVTASKKEESILEAPGVVEVITAADIAAFGALNLRDVLERATGVVMPSSQLFPQNNVSLRGDVRGPDSHVLILLNGRPFRESNTGGQNYPLYMAFPLQAVERIEIVRGPGSVLYGSNAFTGVINVITKTGRKARSEAAVQYGSFGTAQGNVSAGHAWKDLEVFAAAKFSNSRGWRWGLTDAAGITDSVRFHERNVGVTGGARYKGLTLNTLYAQSQQPSLGSDYIWPSVTAEGDRLLVDLGYTHSLGNNWSATANLTHNRGNYRLPALPPPFPFRGNRPYNRSRSRDYLAEVSVNGKLFRGLNLLVGGVADYQTGGRANGAPPPPGQGVEVPLSIIRPYDWIWWSGYGQVEYRPVSLVKLVAGAQLNKTNRVKAALVPRFGTIFNFTPELGAKLLYGEAFHS
ncbi:MAG TPA: TonB-dependent receptor plug domain-containing protein, partial [Myxococcaceae bacterium]|nr:TonB-dependent receptor plug domain-containing protein [Myxococcaceae bacterium]